MAVPSTCVQRSMSVGVTRAKSVNGSNQANRVMLNVTARITILKTHLTALLGQKLSQVYAPMCCIHYPVLSLSAK